MCLTKCLLSLIELDFSRFWLTHRSEGFPLTAYLVPGRDGDGGLARFQSCSPVVVGGFSSEIQYSYTLILKDLSLGSVPDGADRTKLKRYIDIRKNFKLYFERAKRTKKGYKFQKTPTIQTSNQTHQTNPSLLSA